MTAGHGGNSKCAVKMQIAVLIGFLGTLLANGEAIEVEQDVILFEYAIPRDKCGDFPVILDVGKEDVVLALENLDKNYDPSATTMVVNVKRQNGLPKKTNLNVLDEKTKGVLRGLTIRSRIILEKDVYVSRLGGGDPLTVFTFTDKAGNYFALVIDTFIGENMKTLKILSRISANTASKRTYVVPSRDRNVTVHLDFDNPIIVDLMQKISERCPPTETLMVFALTNGLNETEVITIDVSNAKVEASLKELTTNVDVNSPMTAVTIVNMRRYTITLNLKKRETVETLKKLSRETPPDLQPIIIPQIEGKPIIAIGDRETMTTLAFDINNANVTTSLTNISNSDEKPEAKIKWATFHFDLKRGHMDVYRGLSKLCPPIENPYTTFPTKLLTFPVKHDAGKMVLVTLDTTNPIVIDALTMFSSLAANVSNPTRYFLHPDYGEATPLKIDLNSEAVRTKVIEMGTITPVAQIETHHVVFTLPDRGRNVPIVLDVKKHRVIASLKRLSRFVDVNQPSVVFQLHDRRNKNVDVKINTPSARTLEMLKILSEHNADPIAIPKPGAPEPILALTTSNGQMLLDLNNPEISTALREISHGNRNDKTRVVYAQANGVLITLDLNDRDTIKRLRALANRPDEIRGPYHTYITETVTVQIKDMNEDDILLALDVSDADVNAILRKLDLKNGTSVYVMYVPNFDGSASPIAINITDVEVRELLINIGNIISIKPETSLAVFTVRDDRGRVTPIILDMSDHSVEFVLKKLSGLVDENEPMIAMHLKDICGDWFMIKLNPQDGETIKILIDLTQRAAINIQAVQIPQCNSENPLIALTAADEQGKTVALLLDMSNAIVFDALERMSAANDNNSHAQLVYIQTNRGNEKFRVDSSDHETLNKLRMLSMLSSPINIPFVTPVSPFLSMAIKDTSGNYIIVTMNVDDVGVASAIKSLQTHITNVPVDAYILTDNIATCIKLDPTNANVTEALLNLGDVVNHQKNFAVLALPIANDPIILDLSNEEVRVALKNMSDAVDVEDKMTMFQVNRDNYWVTIKLNVEDPFTKAKLLELSQKTEVNIDPIIFPHPTKDNSLVALTVREEERTVCLILDTSDEDVMNALMDMTKINKHSKNAKTVYVRHGGKTVGLRLDFTDEKTAATLRNLPRNAQEIINPFITSASSQIFVPMKDEYGGSVVTLNVGDVMDTLGLSTSSGESYSRYYIVDDSGAASVVVIDVDDENTKQLLMELGVVKSARTIDENLLVFTIADDDGTVLIVLDIGDAKVLSTLKTLSDATRTIDSFTTHVTDEDGATVKLKLSQDETTRGTLRKLARATSVKMVAIPQPGNRRATLALNFHGNFVCLDTNDDKIDAVLRKMTTDNAKNPRAESVYFRDGASYQPIRIDFGDKALESLRDLATGCPTMRNPYTTFNSRFVAVPFVDENGDEIIVTIDSAYPDVVEAITNLSFYSSTSPVFYMRDDRDVKAFYIDLSNATVRRVLVTLGRVEVVDSAGWSWVCITLGGDTGTVPIILNVDNPTVVNMLQSLSQSVDYAKNVTMITARGYEDIAIALNLEASDTVAILQTLTQSSTILSPTQITNVDGKSPLLAFTFQVDGNTIPIVLDGSNRNVLAALRELSTRNEKATIIYVPLDRKTYPLRLDLTDVNILNALQHITKEAPVLPYPHVISPDQNTKRLLSVNIFEGDLVKTIAIDPTVENMNILKAISARGITTTTDFYVNDAGKILAIKIDPNNSTVINILKELGKKIVLSKCSPVEILPANGSFSLITVNAPGANGQITSITLNPNNHDVFEKLLELSKPNYHNSTVIKLNSSLEVHLNLWDPFVSGVLAQTQELSPLHLEVVKVIPAGMTRPLVAFQIVERDGGRMPITLDFNDKVSMLELQYLEQFTEPSRATVFQSGDIRVALDLTDPNTVSTLRMMTRSSPIKIIPFKGSKPLVKINVSGGDGVAAVLVINTNNLPLIRYLTDVYRDSKPYSLKTFFEFEDADGFAIPLGLELQNPDVVEELRDVLKTPFTTFVNFVPPRGFKELGVLPVTINNEVFPATLDLNEKNVSDSLRDISFNDHKASSIITIEDKFAQAVYYLNLLNSTTAEALMKISAMSEIQLLPIKIIPPYGTSVLITFSLPNVETLINLDPNDLDVMRGLKNISAATATSTSIEIQDSEGRMSILNLDLTDKHVIETLLELTKTNEIGITLNERNLPIIQTKIYENGVGETIKFDLSHPNVMVALKAATKEIDEDHPVILLEIQEGDLSMALIKIDLIDPAALKTYKLLSKIRGAEVKNQILYVPIYDGRQVVEIPLDTNDVALLDNLKKLHYARGTSFRVGTGKEATMIQLDLRNSTTVESLRRLGRKHLLRLFPVNIIPPRGKWRLIPMTVPVSTGGTMSVTLDPNFANVMSKFNEMSDATTNSRTALQIKDNAGKFVTSYLDLYDPQTAVTLRQLSRSSYIQVATTKIIPPLATTPLLGIQLITDDGGSTPVTLDMTDQNVVTELERLSTWSATSVPMSIIEIGDETINRSIKLDLTNTYTRSILRKLTKLCPVNIVPVKGKKPFIVLKLIDSQNVLSTVTIDSNDQETIRALSDLIHLNDKSPETLVEFEDPDGFPILVNLQLQNPQVVQKLKNMSLLHVIESVDITPYNGRRLLQTFTLVTNGVPKPITLDLNDEVILDRLQQFEASKTSMLFEIEESNESKSLDLSHQRWAEYLEHVSNNTPIGLYPIKIIPKYGRSPLLSFHLRNKDSAINLDLNDVNVYQQLQQLHDSTGPSTTFEIRDNEGTVSVFKLNFEDAGTLNALLEMSRKSAIKITPVEGKMPILSLSLPVEEDMETISFDLSNSNVINELRRITHAVTDEAKASLIQIKMDQRTRTYAINLNDNIVLKRLRSLTKVTERSSIHTRFVLQIIDASGNVIRIPLAIDDPNIIKSLRELQVTHLFPKVINVNSEEIKLDLDSDDVVKTLRELGRRHLMKESAVKITPPNGHLRLISMVVPNSDGGTLAVTLDPNDGDVMDGMKKISSMQNAWTTTLNVQDSGGENTPFHINLTDTVTSATFKKLSQLSKMRLIQLKIVPAGALIPLVAFQIFDNTSSMFSPTLDLNDHMIMVKLLSVHDDNANATIFDIDAAEQSISLKLDLGKERTLSRLREITRSATIKIIPSMYDELFIAIKLYNDVNVLINAKSDEVIQELSALSRKYNHESAKTLFQFEDNDGFTMPLALPLENSEVVRRLIELPQPRTLAIVHYKPPGEKAPLIPIPLPIKGQLTSVTLDPNKASVLTMLEKLSSHDFHMTTIDAYLETRRKTFKMDLYNPFVAKAVAKLSSNDTLQLQPIRIIPANANTPLIVLKIRSDPCITLDLNDRLVYDRLSQMSSDVPEATTIEVRDADGWVKIVKLNLDDPKVVGELRRLSERSKIRVNCVPGKMPKVSFYVKTNTTELVTLDLGDSSTTNALGEMTSLIGQKPATTIEILDGSENVFKLDFTNPFFLQRWRRLNNPLQFSVSSGHVWVLDKYNRTVVVPVDLHEKDSTPALQNLSIYLDPMLRGNKPIKLDGTTVDAVRVLRRLGRRHLFREFPVKIRPLNGTRYLMPITIPRIYGGAKGLTLDPNDEVTMDVLMKLSDSSNEEATKITVRGTESNVDLYLDLTSGYTFDALNSLRGRSLLQVVSLEITTEGNLFPLLGLQIQGPDGLITVVLDFNEHNVIVELEKLGTDNPTIIIESVEPAMRLDLSDSHTIVVLKRLTEACSVRVAPVQEGTPFLIMRMFGATLTINTNQNDVIGRLNELSRVPDDGSPMWRFQFEDNDGFVIPVSVQLSNPHVWRQMLERYTAMALAQIFITPESNSAPLISMAISISGGIVPVTLDTDVPEVLAVLEEISNDNLRGTSVELSDMAERPIAFNLDMENPRVNKVLIELSKLSPIKTYPITILPLYGKVPLVLFEYRDRLINLDINDLSVVDRLNGIMSLSDKPATHIHIEANDGVVRTLKFDLNDYWTMQMLTTMSNTGMITATPMAGKMPLLNVTTPYGAFDLNLGDPDVLQLLDEVSDKFLSNSLAIQIAARQWYLVDVADRRIVERLRMKQGLVVNETLIVWITDDSNRRVRIRLNVRDPDVVDKLRELSLPEGADATEFNVATLNGSSTKLRLDLTNAYAKRILRKLSRKHMLAKLPLKITPANKTSPLMVMVIPDVPWGTTTVTMDLNDEHVVATLNGLSLGDQSTRTVLNVEAGVTCYLNLEDVETLRTLKKLSNVSQIEVNPVEIVPAGGTDPLIAFTLATAEYETTPFTIDVNEEKVVNELENLGRFVGNPSFVFDFPVHGRHLSVGMNMSNQLLKASLKRITQMSRINVIAADDKTYVRIQFANMAVVIDANDQDSIEALAKLGHDDKSPNTLIVFKDRDGFDIPIQLQLNNLTVARKLIQLSKLCDIPSVHVIPHRNLNPLIALPVVLRGKIHQVMLNTNEPSIVHALETLSVVGSNVTELTINDQNSKKTIYLSLNNPYIAEPLAKINYDLLQLHTVKVIPAQAKFPIISFRPKGFECVNLDVNDPYVHQELRLLSDSAVGFYTAIKVRDIDGQTTTFKFDLNNSTIIYRLLELSDKSKIKLISGDGEMPLLKLTVHQNATLSLDLGDKNVLETLHDITDMIGDSQSAILIEIQTTDGNKRLFKLDFSKPDGITYSAIMSKLQLLVAPATNTLWVPIAIRKLTVQVPLDLTDMTLVETLDTLSTFDSRATTLHTKIHNTSKTIRLLLDDEQTTIRIRELGRKHLLSTFPVKILPPNGNLYLVPIVIANLSGGTISLTLDPNDSDLTDMISLKDDKTTLHIFGKRGEHTTIALDLTDPKTVNRLKKLSEKNPIQITPLKIYPVDGRLPLLGFEVRDANESTAFTVDLNDLDIINELKLLSASDATIIELANGETISLDLNDVTTRDALTQLTRRSKIRIIPVIRKKPIVKLYMGEMFDLDTNNGSVIHDLDEISRLVDDGSASTLFEFESGDGFPIFIYLQLDNPMLATKLKKLKTVSLVSVNFIPRGGSVPITSLWLPMGSGDEKYVSINLNEKIADDMLELLPNDESLPVLLTTHSGECYHIDVTNRYVAESLVQLSKHSSIHLFPLKILRGGVPMITFKTSLNGEIATINLDTNEPQVLKSLKEMSRFSDGNFTTRIEVQDVEGHVLVFKLDLDDRDTFDALAKLSRLNEVKIGNVVDGIPIVSIKSSDATVSLNFGDDSTVETIEKIGERISGEAPVVIELETIGGWKRLRIDSENFLQEYRKIIGSHRFVVSDRFVATIRDKLNRTVEISLYLKDPDLLATLVRLSVDDSSLQTIYVQQIKWGPMTTLKLNFSDSTTINTLRKLGRKHMLRVAPVKAKPVGGERYFISMAVPEINGGTMSITLDPNDERVLTSLRRLTSVDSGTTIEVVSGGHVEALRIDLTDARSSSILKQLSSLSSIQVSMLTVIPAGKRRPLLGFQIADNSGETTPVTLDLNEQGVLDELEIINGLVSGAFGVVLEIETDEKKISVTLDSNNALVKEKLKEISIKSQIKIKPMLGRKSVMVVDLVKPDGRNASVVIDTNDQDVVTDVFKISQEIGDYKPTYIEFEDADGFLIRVSLQLGNPNVIRRLCALKSISLADVNVIPAGKLLPLVVSFVPINNAMTPITIDPNQKLMVEDLEKISSDGAPMKLEIPGFASRIVFWFDFNNPYIADRLDKLSRKNHIHLYPLLIVPAGGSAPLVSFEFEREGESIVINLDINDDHVLHALRAIPVPDDNDVVNINVEDNDGQIYSFNLNIDAPTVIETLLELTQRNAVRIIPNTFQLPTLRLGDVEVALSDAEVLKAIERYAETIVDGTPVISIEILEGDGRRKQLKLDLSKHYVKTNDEPVIKLENIDVLYVSLTDSNNRMINVSLDVTDREIVQVLRYLRSSPNARGSVYKITTRNGESFNINMDTSDPNTQKILKLLSRKHLIRTFPINVTPPGGNRHLISIVVSNPRGGTIALDLDPNIPIVDAGLDDLMKESSNRSITVIHNVDDHGSDVPIKVDITNQRVTTSLKQLSSYSKFKICNVEITSRGKPPLLGMEIIDGDRSVMYTIDLYHPTVRSLFERNRDDASRITRIEHNDVTLNIDFTDPATKTQLMELTKASMVKFVSCSPTNIIITINDTRIDTNDDDLIEKLYDVAKVEDDGSPKTTFEFQDDDGFTSPVEMQLQNPLVVALLTKLIKPQLVASITVIPPGKLVPLTSLSIPIGGGFVFTTIDTNALSTMTILNKLTIDDANVTKIQREDLEAMHVNVKNPYVADALLALSKKCAVQLYPITVVPSRDHLPLIAFRFENESFNLDLNDEVVLRTLWQLSRETRDANLTTEIDVRGDDGQKVRVKLELSKRETVEELMKLSHRSKIQITPSGRYVPTLNIQGTTIDLNSQRTRKKLEELTQFASSETIIIQILEPDGDKTILNLDVNRFTEAAH